jgi:hypothetical protein
MKRRPIRDSAPFAKGGPRADVLATPRRDPVVPA